MNRSMNLYPAMLLFAAGSALAQDGTPLGRWITESGNLEVEIAPCAPPPAGMSVLCGKVVRVIGNRSMSGPGQEMQPADTRPALGMTLLTGLQVAGEGVYEGTIYNRENAKHYSVKLTPAEPAQLLVRGYVGLPLFGRTQVWRRPSPDAAAPADAASGATR